MTTPYPHADILRAIAEGKQIQWQDPRGNWRNTAPGDVLLTIGACGPARFRIAPETVLVNGVECPKNADDTIGNPWTVCVVLRSDPVNLLVPFRYEKEVEQFWYATEVDARTVFDALCKPFKEGV